jgi:hypothetical protein
MHEAASSFEASTLAAHRLNGSNTCTATSHMRQSCNKHHRSICGNTKLNICTQYLGSNKTNLNASSPQQ